MRKLIESTFVTLDGVISSPEKWGRGMSVDVIRPGDESYDRLSGTFAHSGSPAHVFLPRTAEEVVSAVLFARREGLELSARSGGHHGAGYATNDGGVVIDVSRLNEIEVTGVRVRVGPGALWAEVARALAPHGLAISSGDTTSVGVGGLMLGGGIGWLVRRYGLALDHVVAAEVVTAHLSGRGSGGAGDLALPYLDREIGQRSTSARRGWAWPGGLSRATSSPLTGTPWACIWSTIATNTSNSGRPRTRALNLWGSFTGRWLNSDH